MALIYLANLEEQVSDNRTDRFRSLHFPTGLALVSGALSLTGHELRAVDNYLPGASLDAAIDEMERAQPDYIMLSGFLGNHQYRFVKRLTAILKAACPRAVLIMGGPMASTIPDLLMAHSRLDYVVVGEGEETIIDLLDKLERGGDVGGVAGILYRDKAGRVWTTPARERMRDLAAMPAPRYDLFDMDSYVKFLQRSGRCWEISTSRGCYAHCKYCKLTFGNKITFRPVWHVIEEMTYIKTRYGIDRFNFVDDNFLNSARQVNEMADALAAAPEKFKFRFQGRADRINGTLAARLREVGCFDISYGLESGSQDVIDYMGKVLDLKKAEANLAEVLALGIDVHATFIVGMPVETAETIAKTKDFIRRVGLPTANAGILTPFPGTEIYRLAKEAGKIIDDDAYCDALGIVYEDVYVNLTPWPDDALRSWRDEINAVAPRKQAAYASAAELLAD